MRRPCPARILVLACLLQGTLLGCGSTARLARPTDAEAEIGNASYYAHRFHGRRTAFGEVYDEDALTAAHPRLPPGTRVRITNLRNGRDVIVRINDRGPFVRDRVIDVSYAAARTLGFLRDGLARVRIEVVARGGARE